jgi:hypothetical protein
MADVFQWKIYLISIVIVLILNLTGFIRAVIVWACKLGPGSDTLDTSDDEVETKKKMERSSRVIGCVEKFLYCYFLIRNYESALGCLLLFKAFTHWLHQQEQAQVAEGAQNHAPLSKALLRYYSYAIGNFISLLFAIVICEGVSGVVKAFPELERVLWVQKGRSD